VGQAAAARQSVKQFPEMLERCLRPSAQITRLNLDPADPVFRNGFDLACDAMP
jgi:hypothetical protein